MANSKVAGRAKLILSLDDRVKAGLQKVQSRLNAFSSRLFSIGGQAIGIGSAIASAFILPIKAASDLEETMNKFNVVFGDNSAEVKKWSDNFASEVGRSQKQIADFMAGSQDLFVPLGFDSGSATDLSKQVTGLALDLASFNNMADTDTLRDLHAALTGSGEVMKKYGVIVSEAAVKQELLNQGLDPKAVTEQQKVQARLNIIMAGTTAAQGDAIRSAGGFANQMKALQGAAMDASAAIGQAILPTITSLVGYLRRGVEAVTAFVTANPGLVQSIAIAAGAFIFGGLAILGMGLALSIVAVAAGGFATAIGVIGSVLAAVVSPLGAVVAGIAGLVAWFATSTEAGRTMVENLSAWFGGLSTIATEAFAAISAALAAGDITAAGEVLWAALKLLWLQGTDALRTKWIEFTGVIAKVWHTAWAGMMRATAFVWGNLERGFSHTAQFLSDLWDGVILGMRLGLNELIGWFKYAWAYITGATDAELEKITAETSAAGELLKNDTLAGIGKRDQAARASRDASQDTQSGKMDAIGQELEKRLAGVDPKTQEKLAAAEKALADARAKFEEAKKTASDAAANTTTPATADKVGQAQLALAGVPTGGGSSGPKSAAVFDASMASQQFGGKTRSEDLLEKIERNTKPKKFTFDGGVPGD